MTCLLRQSCTSGTPGTSGQWCRSRRWKRGKKKKSPSAAVLSSTPWNPLPLMKTKPSARQLRFPTRQDKSPRLLPHRPRRREESGTPQLGPPGDADPKVENKSSLHPQLYFLEDTLISVVLYASGCPASSTATGTDFPSMVTDTLKLMPPFRSLESLFSSFPALPKALFLAADLDSRLFSRFDAGAPPFP